MKVAVVGDLHIGLRRDDEWTARNQLRFFEFFQSECKKRDVKATIQTGDWFDVRSGITQATIRMSRTTLVPIFQSIGPTYVLVGNHDMHLRETITPNSCREVLGHYDQFTIIDEAQTITIDGVTIDLIPWICRENRDSTAKFIEQSTSDICVGHFELAGFYYYTGLKSEGSKSDFLAKYKQVWSGHFHCQSEHDNIKYLGTPYTLTLGDANDSRGFWIFDTVTRELEYIENPDCWHKKIYFNADTFNIKTIDELKDRAVRIVVEKRSSETRKIDFDVISERIAAVAKTLDVIDQGTEFSLDDEDGTIEVEDTKSFVDTYIDELDESDTIKARCKYMFGALQREALELE